MKASYARLDQIAGGYRGSQVLFTAVRLGIFDALGIRKMPAEKLAVRLATDLRATRILCDSLVPLGLLTKHGRRYANTPLALEFLLPGAPRSQTALLWHGARLYERWGHLFDVVKTGRPVPRERASVGQGEEEHAFARAMASSAALGARETAARLDLRHVRTLLDIGGGPGVYAIEFARRQPGLKAVVFDSAKTLEVARANIAKAGLSQRVSVQAGDAFKDDLGGPYDIVLLSNIVHVYSEEENRRLVARGAQALAPGGRICIKDFILDPRRTGPTKASLFAVNMLVNTDGGDCYTVAEMKGWLRRAGLKFAGSIKLTPPAQLVLGRRAG